jgi:hypothetical protein
MSLFSSDESIHINGEKIKKNLWGILVTENLRFWQETPSTDLTHYPFVRNFAFFAG